MKMRGSGGEKTKRDENDGVDINRVPGPPYLVYSEGVEERDDAPPVRPGPRTTRRELAKVAGAV